MKGDALARRADALAAQIAPLLAGKGAFVQGAALADLAAVWLAGHIVTGDREATETMRRDLFEAHCRAVWELVDLYDGRR
jgi:hypothetical protein